MSTNNYRPTVEASNPSETPQAEEPLRLRRHPSTPRHLPATCCPAGQVPSLREATRLLRRRYGNGLSELEVALLAVAWLDHQPLRAGTNHLDRLILCWSRQLVERESVEARTALAAARAVAQDRYNRATDRSSARPPGDELLLDEAFRISELFAALGLDQFEVIQGSFVPEPMYVRLEYHQIGPHSIEVWGEPPPRSPATRPTKRDPLGNLMGQCFRCGNGVGDQDTIYGVWVGNNWTYTGYGLASSQRRPPHAALLCPDCAVRAKYRLITPPRPNPEYPASSVGAIKRAHSDPGEQLQLWDPRAA